MIKIGMTKVIVNTAAADPRLGARVRRPVHPGTDWGYPAALVPAGILDDALGYTIVKTNIQLVIDILRFI